MRALYLLLFTYALGAASGALAHAPAKVLQFISTDPSNVIVATNRGLIFGDLATRDFKLLCNEAYDVSALEESLRFARLADGRLAVASSNGLFTSADRGCTWQAVAALDGQSVPALSQHPGEPDTLFVTTYSKQRPFFAGLRVSRDGGESFETLFEAPNEYLRTILLTQDESSTLYFAAWVPGMPSQHYLVRSNAAGTGFERTLVPIDEDERELLLLAVNPKDPNELLARVLAAEPVLGERLLWSGDGGRSFETLGKLAHIMDARFSEDGTTAYVGSVDGLARVVGPAGARTLEPPTGTARISQVSEREGAVLAGGFYRGFEESYADGVGVAEGPDLDFSRWFDFSEVDEQVQCSSELERACRVLWLDWLVENAPVLPVDGGVPDAGAADAMAPRTPPPTPGDAGAPAGSTADAAPPQAEARSESGCRLSERGANDGGWLLAVGLMLLLARRRSHG